MSVEDKKRLGRRFFKGYTKLVESKYWYNHYVALIFGASPASNLGSLIAIDWKGNELISVTRFFGNNDNVKLYLGSNPETNMYELWLGLIGLDGDGSEFIIQSRESIDLDSKTVETLPSYLKVIPISWQKNNDFSELGGLIGTATANKNGLMSKIFAVTDIERGKGLIIDYKADSNGLYTSSSLIEIYVYSGANTAFYRVMSIPIGSKNIEIKYMGVHWCDFKYADSKLYVLPKSDDSSISYKVSLVRRTRPIFSTIDFSDFSNITGEIITPTPD